MPQTRSSWPLGLAFNLLFWLAAVALDFPRTFWDDGVIIGPAISLAETGRLQNPYLTRGFYSGDVYLFYPPGFFWVLAGWIKLFGKSVPSLSLFWAACGFIASSALAELLQRLSGSRIAWVVAPLLLFGCVAYTGHRYEILAFASYFAGLLLATAGRRGVGYLLLILTPTIAPTLLAVSAISVIAVFAHHWRGRFVREALLVAVAFIISFLTIVAGVGGDMIGLVQTMYAYRSIRMGVGGQDLIDYRLLLAAIGLNVSISAFWMLSTVQGVRSFKVQLPLLLGLAMLLTPFIHARPTMIVAMNLAMITLAALAIADAMVARNWRKPGLRAAANAMPALGLASIGIMLLLLNFRYTANIALPPFDPAWAKAAQAAMVEVDDDRLIVADPRILKDALGFPTGRRIEDTAYKPLFPALPADETWITSRAALAWAVTPASVPTGAGLLDTLFIAKGMQRVPNDGICVFDATDTDRWQKHPGLALIDAVCGAKYLP